MAKAGNASRIDCRANSPATARDRTRIKPPSNISSRTTTIGPSDWMHRHRTSPAAIGSVGRVVSRPCCPVIRAASISCRMGMVANAACFRDGVGALAIRCGVAVMAVDGFEKNDPRYCHSLAGTRRRGPASTHRLRPFHLSRAMPLAASRSLRGECIAWPTAAERPEVFLSRRNWR